MFVGAATMGIQEIQVQVPYDRTIPLLGLHPKELKKDLNMIIYIFMFVAALVTIGNKHGNNLRGWKSKENVLFI